MMTPPTEEDGELSNGGLPVDCATENGKDRVIVAYAMVSCNVLERAWGGYSKYFLGGGTKHLKGSGRQVLVLEEGGGISC